MPVGNGLKGTQSVERGLGPRWDVSAQNRTLEPKACDQQNSLCNRHESHESGGENKLVLVG